MTAKAEVSASSAIGLTAAQVVVQAVTLFIAYRVGVSQFGLAMVGIWSVASAAVTLGRVGDLGFAGALPRLLAQRRAGGVPADELVPLIDTALLATLAGTLALSLLLFAPLLWFTRSIAGPDQQAVVLPFLLMANAALLMTAAFVAISSCLDGLGRFRERAVITMAGALINVVTLMASAPWLGPQALAAGAGMQALVTAMFGWSRLRHQIPALGLLPRRWSRAEFRGLLAIGKFTQANSLLIMAFEPTSRLLAGRFGGAEFAALFDFAAKVAGNVRLLFSSFTQALVPFYASLKSRDGDMAALLQVSTALTALLGAAASAIALALGPMLSLFAIGHVDDRFLNLFSLLLLGNLLNILGGPAYSHSLGAGAISATTQSLGLQAALFVGLACVLQLAGVVSGVAIAYATAVAVTGLFLLVRGLNALAIPGQRLLPLLAASVMPVAAVLLVLVVAALPQARGIGTMLGVGGLLLLDLVIRYRRAARIWFGDIIQVRMAARATD